MANIDATGITIQTLLEWKTELEAAYQSVDPEWDVSTNTPDGQIIAALSEILANLDESVLDAYNSSDPDKAVSQALDAILALSNITRRAGTYSTAIVQLAGVQSTVVPAGTLIENSVTGTQWSLDSNVVIGASPTDGAVTCTEIGAQSAAIGELTKIATPVSGLQSVDNSASATVGQNTMTDQEARTFREETISNDASNTLDAIYSAVALVTGVSLVAIYNNNTGAVDSNGLPANSFAVIAKGGVDADIAAAIYSKLPPGPAMYGGTNTTTVNVQSPVNTNTQDITFGRPTDVPLHIQVNITETGNFTTDQLNAIKQAVVDFAAGDLFDDDQVAGYTQRAWRIGEDIDSGMLYTPVNYIVGQSGQGYVTSIYLDTVDPPTAASTVSTSWEELASVDVANIDIVLT